MNTQLNSVDQWWRPRFDEREGVPVNQPAAVVPRGQGRENRIAFWSLMAFTVILLLSPQLRYPVLEPFRIAMLSAGLAVIAHTAHRLSRGMPIIDLNQATIITLALVGWAILSVPFSFWPGGSVDFLLSNYFKTIIVFLLLANIINTLPKLRAICWALALVSVPMALETIQNFLNGTFMTASERALGYEAALTANPNDLALMMNLILPVTVGLFLSTVKFRWRLLLSAIILLQATSIIVTFSRSGFVTLGVVMLVFMWRFRHRPERVLAPAVIALFIFSLPFLPVNYVDRMETIVNIEADSSGSAQIRLSDMLTATGLVLSNPIVGSGVGMNIFAMNEARGETWTEVHNVYLELGVDLGLPGVILFLALFWRCLKSTAFVTLNSAREGPSGQLFYLAEGIRVSLIGFAVAAIFYPVAYHFYFYYFAGLALALIPVYRSEYGNDGTENLP